MNNYIKKISTNNFTSNEYILDVKKAQNIYIQSDNITSYTLKVSLNEQNFWVNTPGIRLSDFNIVNTIEDNNIYLIDVSGFNYFKIILSDPNDEGFVTIKVEGDLW